MKANPLDQAQSQDAYIVARAISNDNQEAIDAFGRILAELEARRAAHPPKARNIDLARVPPKG